MPDMPSAPREVRLFIACSLDGFIAGQGDDIDWLLHDADYGYAEFMAGVDTVLMGRRTYELARAFDPWPYAGLRTIVFARRPMAPDVRVEFTAESPAGVVAALRGQPGRGLYLVGGGLLVAAFLDAGLLDEAIVSVHPLVLGGGVPLFPPGTRRTALRFTDVVAWPSGLVTLRYGRIGADLSGAEAIAAIGTPGSEGC